MSDLLQTREISGGILAQVGGDIDLTSSPVLRTELTMLLKKSYARLVLDLSEVGFMDSSGVATMVDALRQQRAGGRKLVLMGLQPRVRSIFEISRLDSLFTIVENEEAAMKA